MAFTLSFYFTILRSETEHQTLKMSCVFPVTPLFCFLLDRTWLSPLPALYRLETWPWSMIGATKIVFFPSYLSFDFYTRLFLIFIFDM